MSIISSSTPRVSGNIASTTKNCTTMQTAKNANGSACVYAATIGKAWPMIAFMPQCVALPSAWPRERTAVGKISREVHPDHRALREREERDEHDQHHEQVLACPAPCP